MPARDDAVQDTTPSQENHSRSGARPSLRLVLAELGETAAWPGQPDDWRVRRVDSRAALVAAVRAETPDAVVVAGPTGTGPAALADLRACPGAEDVPALVLAPADDADERLRVYEAGAGDYIAAPVTPRELAARVRACLDAGRRRHRTGDDRRFLEHVLSGIDDALVVLDRDWRYRFANERVAELTGVPCAELLGREIWQVFPALADTAFATAAREAMAERETRRARFEYAPLGVVFHTRIYPSDEGLTIFATDVTETDRARAALEASEERFRALAGSVREVFWIFDNAARRYDYVSPAIETVYGVTPEQLYADPDLPPSLLVDANDRAVFRNCRAGHPPRGSMRFRIRRPDGPVRWIEAQCYPFERDDAGELRRICGVSRDVTAQVAQAQRLAADRDEQSERARALERRFRLLIEGTRDYAIYMLDTGGRIASWNEGADRLTGYTEAEVRGRHFSILYTAADRERGSPGELLAAAEANGSAEDEGWRVRRDGGFFWANATITAVRDEHGRLEGYGKVLRDLTERHEAECRREELVADLAARTRELEAANRSLEAHGQRLRELSARVRELQESQQREVARELHDDIAQRITALRLLLDNADTGAGDAGEAIHEAREQAAELLTAVRDLMADLHPSELEDLGLLPALRRLGRRLSAAWGVPVAVHNDAGREGFGAELDTTCYRIAQEAVGNALRHSGCSRVDVSVGTDAGGIRVEVADDGRGFDPDSGGEPGGFGLLGMRERAGFHDGEVDIDSTPGRGTRVTARLPRARPAPPPSGTDGA